MSLLALHLNDAGITVLDADRIVYREPGVALLDNDTLTLGLSALANARVQPRGIQNRFWSELLTEPLRDTRFNHLSNADLASRQLELIWQQVAATDGRLVVAVPAYLSKDQLALFLGIAAELNVPVTGMVDAAVAATRREYRGAVPVHVDISLHSTVLTRIAQTERAAADRSAVVDESGLLALYDGWIKVIAETFVRQSRFDPLHTAETEQTLQDRLPEWLAAASAHDAVALEIAYGGVTHSAEIESLQLVAAAAPVYQRVVSHLRALYRAGETPALQLTDRAARMPGLAEMLRARVGGDVFLLEPGATVRGLYARARDLGARNGGTGVSLVRQLPWDQSAVSVEAPEAGSKGGQPTHVLFGDTAYLIDDSPLNVGSQPADGRWIDLHQPMPGVSRRHCAIQRQNGQCIVHDFSRYGSFLNGHAIDGSAVLQVGDQIRIGTPGFELRMITAERPDGS